MKFQKSQKNWLEWTVFSVSLLLLLGVVGLLLRQAAGNHERPPDLVLTLGTPEKATQGFKVSLTLTNRGDQTAQQVGVEVRAGKPVDESSELHFDFVSSGEEKRGWAAFSGSPTNVVLKARVTGYISE